MKAYYYYFSLNLTGEQKIQVGRVRENRRKIIFKPYLLFVHDSVYFFLNEKKVVTELLETLGYLGIFIIFAILFSITMEN